MKLCENRTELIYLYICLGTEVATFVKHDVTQEAKRQVSTNDRRRDFQDRLFSSGSNIKELLFVTSYAPY